MIAGLAKKFEKALTAAQAAASDPKTQQQGTPPAADAAPKPPTS